PIAAGKPAVRFAVSMAIFDSTNGVYDCFRWSVYNIRGERLFTIDFDNFYTNINYILDDDVPVPTGLSFELADVSGNKGILNLEVTMNFASNRWSASLTGVNPVLIV